MKRVLVILVLLLLSAAVLDAHPFSFSVNEELRRWALVLLFIVLAGLLVVSYANRRSRNQSIEEVRFDEHEVIRHVSDGLVEKIHWDEIDRISIVTTDAGPFTEDAFWILENVTRTKGCVIGNGAEGFEKLLERLQSLAGFRDDLVIEAMGCTSNSTFVVWERAGDALVGRM